MKKLALLFVALFISLATYAKMITFRGVYKGENVYVNNPYNEIQKRYCVTYVYVNGKKVVSRPRRSAFEVSFDTMEVGTKIEIKVYGHQECIDDIKLLNPAAIKSDAMFSFVSSKLTKDNIAWRAKGETPKGYYLIKFFLNKEWVTYKKIEAKHSVTEDNYSIPIKTFPGSNTFKLVFVEGDGITIESKEKTVVVGGDPVSFTPVKVSEEIVFSPSQKVNYKIINLKNEVVKQGVGAVIDCSGLEKKQYYTLYYNNQKGRFYKKK